jgi:uncharacterized protein YndB with AHSA1/START domain
MAAGSDNAAAPLELVVSRLVSAPRALVFQAWTQPEHAARWWGPQGFSIVSCRLEPFVGGAYRVAMRAPHGTEHTKRGVYQEIVPPERLVFTYAWEDPDGNPGHEMRITVTFEARGEQTLLTLRQTGFTSAAERDSHRGGWTSCFERCADYVTASAMGIFAPSH